MRKYTTLSTLGDLVGNPIGRDLAAKMLGAMGADPSIIDKNPLIGALKLGALSRLSGGRLDEQLLETILRLLNSAEDMPEISCTGSFQPTWWKDMAVYQIYPRSFCDSNGDGIGDLPGITSKLDYISRLGVNAIWLSPICDSPNDDNGYDIRDYRKIMSEFGTMEDFEALLAAAHERGIKVIMDMVLNHSSDEHEWFRRALAGEQKYKDYYYFHDGSPDTPPNNWQSFFGGSAWRYYPELGQWALHTFSSKQMDLNWSNPELRQELYSILNFWLDKGVDGFRLDVISLISKEPGLPDGCEAVAKLMGFRGIEHYFFGPQLHEYLRELNSSTFGKYDAFTVGECPGTGLNMNRMITADFRRELNTVISFDHLDQPGKSKYDDYAYDLRYMKKVLTEQQLYYGDCCWNILFFENHDNPRMISKVNPKPQHREALSKLFAVVMMTLSGTPFIYQGQELAMINTTFTADELRDVEALNMLKELRATVPEKQALAHVNAGARDHARLPMHWSGGKNGGFTEGEPWIKCGESSPIYSAEQQLDRADSPFNAFCTLIKLRASTETLRYGRFEPYKRSGHDLFCYFRILGGSKYYIEINLTDKPRRRPKRVRRYTPVFMSNGALSVELRPYEANVYKCTD